MTVPEKLAYYSIFDSAILRHGFAPFMRDYDLIVQPVLGEWKGDPGTYLYRFTHCPEANYTSLVRNDVWSESWNDLYTDYKQWEAAVDAPAGFVWGVNWATVYPGPSYKPNSAKAADWTARFGKPMHEVLVETNAYRLQLIFHDITIHKLGDDGGIMDTLTIPITNC
jgi:hypothetical protein